MYNNFLKAPAKDPYSYDIKKKQKKQVRKPVAENFIPKRFALSMDPPMIILEYLVNQTGKLYHHKMRLESKLKQTKNKDQLLKYIKDKHYLYFINSKIKIKDTQIQKLLDKILENINPKNQRDNNLYLQKNSNLSANSAKIQQLPVKKQVIKQFDFLQYGDEDQEQQQQYQQQEWDLDMDQNVDIV